MNFLGFYNIFIAQWKCQMDGYMVLMLFIFIPFLLYIFIHRCKGYDRVGKQVHKTRFIAFQVRLKDVFIKMVHSKLLHKIFFYTLVFRFIDTIQYVRFKKREENTEKKRHWTHILLYNTEQYLINIDVCSFQIGILFWNFILVSKHCLRHNCHWF